MRIIGISPLDKDSTVCLVDNGCVIAAMAEERFSRKKMHEGFPHLAMTELFERYNITPESVDYVAYSFYEAAEEEKLMRRAHDLYRQYSKENVNGSLFSVFRNLPDIPPKIYNIPSLKEEKLYMKKPWYMDLIYTMASNIGLFGSFVQNYFYKRGLNNAATDHAKYQTELEKGLQKFGLDDKLVRLDHHLCHSANAYFTSGFDESLIITLDGYGSGLAGSVSIGSNGAIERVHELNYPASLGEFYERVTSSLGFKPARHEGKIVGLAAYDNPDLLYDVVRSFFEVKDGDIFYNMPHNFFFSRYLASAYPKPAVAAAYQKVLETVACEYIAYWQEKTGLKNLVLSGGVVANVKANQRFFEIQGIEKIFIHPNMGDGGCSVGAALLLHAREESLTPYKISDVYWGPDYTDDEIHKALIENNLIPDKPDDLEKEVAKLLAGGKIVARFNGRMEYGPRALGNRSILYHGQDPEVNLWLNKQLKRTEFMPFAPATLYEEREKNYKNIDGAEYSAQFMTITFDTTEFMTKNCPAAVHVDATARPQLVKKESNESFYRVIEEYYKLTGIPSIINTSFNMHEEPIVCTPHDAITAFKQGHLHYLAIGPFLVKGDSADL